MEGRETVNPVKVLLALAILMHAVLRPAAMQETVATPATAGLEVASITRKTSGTKASGGSHTMKSTRAVRPMSNFFNGWTPKDVVTAVRIGASKQQRLLKALAQFSCHRAPAALVAQVCTTRSNLPTT